MKRFFQLASAGLAVATVGCSSADDGSLPMVNARVTVAPTSAAASASALGLASLLLGGPVDTSVIDSVMVTVIRVDVLPELALGECRPPEGDSLHGFRPGNPPNGRGRGRGPDGPRPRGCGFGPMGEGPLGPGGFDGPREHPPRPDSLMPPDSGWGSKPNHWYSLAVVGNGRIDLLHLPPAGITLASGNVPPGEYDGARLIVNDAFIWFNTAVTANDSSVLQPDVAYPVWLPRRRGGQMGIMTSSGFTIPDSGGDVQLLFDASSLVRGVIAVDSGKVLLKPVMHPRH